MTRMLKLIALAALLCTVHGQTPSKVDSTTSSMVAPTNTPTTQPPTMAPTTQPPTPFPTDDTFFLMDANNASKVCLHMEAGLGIYVNYTSTNPVKNTSTIFDFMKSASVDKAKSSCNSKTYEATLVVQYTPGKNPYFVTFMFAGVKGAEMKWNVTDVILQFTFNKTDFPGYAGDSPKDEEAVMSSSNSSLFDNGNVALKQSFGCAANRTLEGFTPLAPMMNISLFMTELKVQAFQFTNETGAFDKNEVVCLADVPNTGNKIVPIAVGAALAGLVIVVLVAYLIGRLRNRKKSSYEALS